MSESFDWNYPGLNWSHFHSLANLLSLQNGGQAEPSSLSDTVLEEDWDPTPLRLESPTFSPRIGNLQRI